MQRRKAAEPTRIRLDTNEDEVRVPARQSPQILHCPDCDSDAKELLVSGRFDLRSENGTHRDKEEERSGSCPTDFAPFGDVE
jgi:hypothetical protein